ncbi:MAG TPA: sporulation protein [Bacillus bacterium]|nr:sporulation protein [Bacillus sp. (in: firmicutes)]
MKREWNAVEILRHSRHDWLNKLQLIKGNLALDRLDRVNEIIEEIIIDTKNEAKLSNLKAHKLASLLMLFNWDERHFFLDFEVIGNERNLSFHDDELTSWCFGFLNNLNKSIKPFAENNLILSIELSDEDVRFIYDFSGIIVDKRRILNYLENQKNHGIIKVLEYEVHKNELVVITKILL